MNPYGDYVNETAMQMLALLQTGELTVGRAIWLLDAMERQAEKEEGEPYPWEGFSTPVEMERTPWPVLSYVAKRQRFEFADLRGWQVFIAPGGEGHFLCVEADMWYVSDARHDLMTRRTVGVIEAKSTSAEPTYAMWKACARIAYVLNVGTGVW